MNGASSPVRDLQEALAPSGILLRGIADFGPAEGPLLGSGEHARSVILLGNAGRSIWPAFSRWRKCYDGPDPLDMWSKEIIRPVASLVGGTAYFPSDPPWQPFQRWAMRAEGLKPSPLGILVHPEFGLWHGYRGAIGLPHRIGTARVEAIHPCDTCAGKPCLRTCPVAAVGEEGFDVRNCRSHLITEEGRNGCMTGGCVARNACPVGAAYRYSADQLVFHMRALNQGI